MALIATAFVFDHSGKQAGTAPTNSPASIVVTASEADQLDRALDDIQLLHEVDATAVAPAQPASSVM